MSSKFIPKVEIINYFDSLINKVDIHFEECLENYNQDQVIGDLECFKKLFKHYTTKDRLSSPSIHVKFHDSFELAQKRDNEWSESTKVVDYLNQERLRTIEQLRKGLEESLEYYKENLSQCDFESFDEMKSQLFKDKFYFQVSYQKPSSIISWIFNLYTIVTDFYLSQTDINLLE